MFCSSFEILLSFFNLINGGQGKHPELELRSTCQMRKYLFIVCLFFLFVKTPEAISLLNILLLRFILALKSTPLNC